MFGRFFPICDNVTTEQPMEGLELIIESLESLVLL